MLGIELPGPAGSIFQIEDRATLTEQRIGTAWH
jgi:hypothetical protein